MIIRLDKKAVSWNKFYAGVNHWVRTKLKNEWREFIYFSLADAKACQVPYSDKVDIRITSYQPRPFDPDNICSKLIIDGLKDYGIIKDDTSKYINQVTTISKKSKEIYIELEIKPSTG